MYLSDFDLQQLDEQKLTALPAEQKDALLVKLLRDLKDARERLQANSQTSSRPPSSDPPWQGPDGAGEALAATAEGAGAVVPAAAASTANAAARAESSAVVAPATGTPPARAADETPKKAGRPGGAPGHSRSVSLPVRATVIPAPETCACCGQALEPAAFLAGTGL